MTALAQLAAPRVANDNIRTPDTGFFAGIRRCAIVETLVFLACVCAIDALAGDGTRFIGTALHPFWIIVLMVTFQYGVGEALMAALLASAFLLIGNLPEQSMAETMYDYILRVSTLPMLWVGAALVLGSIRSRQLREKKALVEDAAQSKTDMDTVVRGYTAMKHSKEQLELRLAKERCSVLTVYKIARALETVDPCDALSGITELVSVALNPIKFSLYRWKNGVLALEASYGWDKADGYLRSFTAASPLAQQVVGKNRILSVVDEKDEPVLGGQGVLAGVIRDEKSGKIFGMLKIEEIAFADLGLQTHETFRVVCDWIGRVYANNDKYQSMLAHARTHGTDMLQIPDNLVKRATYANPAFLSVA